ncbi:MAG TPA: SDR family NAD(P)-dependent oxidoreductase [Candidatus Binataceae bacterium]|nr:SDR family NAD(P)-dependent oxidoreductase [Candidatus Binataceae bacterium]
MGRLENKVAVVTGSASGMGRATAIRFAREGAKVVVADLNSQGGELVVSEIAAAGGNAVFQRTDVTREADIEAVIDRAVRQYGRLDVTYNNAGVLGALGYIEDIKSEDWDRTLAVLARSVFFGIKHSVKPMRRSGGGSIISTSSLAGLHGVPGLPAYTAAKFAVVGLTQTAAAELGKDQIRVNCICPGGIDTPLVAGTFRPDLASRGIPLGRLGLPDDIADLALFLASDDSRWITGTAMVVDGGSNVAMARFEFPQAGSFSGPSFESKKS